MIYAQSPTAHALVCPSMRISGVVPTFFDARTRLAREAVDTLSGHFKERLYEPIRRSTRLAEAPSYGKTILEYDPRSPGALAYKRLAEEVIARAGVLAGVSQ